MIVPPELRQSKFKRLLQKRQRLIGFLETFIAQAIQEGDFRALDPSETARMLLAIDEVVLDAARSQAPLSPRDHASAVVDFALHALVSEHRRVTRILRAVEAQLAADTLYPTKSIPTEESLSP
jgi:hypothetical protein